MASTTDGGEYSDDEPLQNYGYETRSRLAFAVYVIILFLKCGIICAAIILVIMRLTSDAPDFKPEWQRFSLYLFTTKKNFTDAARICKQHSKPDADSRLAFFYNKHEEEFMRRVLKNLLTEPKTKEQVAECENKFFVGMRKSVGEEWITADGNHVFGPDFLPNMYGKAEQLQNEFCSALNVQQEFKVMQIPCQHTEFWKCFVCEHPCKDNESQTCFDLWNDKEVTKRIEAIEYCQMTDVPGELVGVRSSKLLNDLKVEILKDLKNCTDKIAISNVFNLKYESIYEEAMTFVSNRFDITSGTNINKHCLLLEMKSFKWIFANCMELHCFLCKITENTNDQDYPMVKEKRI